MSFNKSATAFFAAALAIAATPTLSRADDVTDLYFQQSIERYFDYPQNARTFGMAGSSVATSTDSSSLFGNPGGLGFMKGGEVSGTYGFSRISGDEFPTDASVEQRTNAGTGIIALPLGPTNDGLPDFGNIALGWSSTSGDWHDDSFDTEMERTQVAAAYAFALSEAVTAGYSLGWTDDRFQSKAIFNYPMGDGFRHTLGVQWAASSDTRLGLSAFFGHGEHHALFGPGIEGSTKTRQFGADFGVQQQIGSTLIALGLDYRHLSSDGDVEASIPANVVGGDENGNYYDVRLGIEQPVTEWAVVRAGYRYAGLDSYRYNRVELNDINGSANYNAWTLGFGLMLPVSSTYIKSVNLDYGVEYRAVGDDDWQHLVTLSVPFTLCS